jgi:hypothetical protein
MAIHECGDDRYMLICILCSGEVFVRGIAVEQIIDAGIIVLRDLDMRAG